METLNNNFKTIAGLLIIALAFIYFFTVLLMEGKENPQVIIAIVSMVSTVCGYYYGSSTTGNKKVNKGETTAEISATITQKEDGKD